MTRKWKCFECSPTRAFASLEQLRAHSTQYHIPSFKVTAHTPGRAGEQEQIIVRQIDGYYICPRCQAPYTTKGGCRKHLQRSKCNTDDVHSDEHDDDYSDECDDEHEERDEIDDEERDVGGKDQYDELEEQLPVIAMPGHQSVPMPAANGSVPMTRQHDEAVLYSCHQLHASNAEQKRTLGIIGALELEPFTMTDTDGAEQNALAHTSIVAKLAVGHVKVCSNPATSLKRKHSECDPCVRCFPAQAPGLEYVFSVSPYASSLKGRKFLELDQSVCQLLNRDWEFSAHLRFACARILAGCIILNNCNGQAIIANTVEVYGRTKLVDAHREPFVVRKDKPVATSLPPSFKTPYNDVWPVTVMAPEGERLVIGTSSFDALITSSLRLDTKIKPSVGGTTPSFVLSNVKDSRATRIFLDEESLTDGLRLAAKSDTWSLSNSNLIWQLRQTKTKFHDPSSYYLCRASSHFARNHTCQPYSIFSLAAFDQAHNGDGVAISQLFHNIATKVITDGTKAMLNKRKVEDLLAGCTQQGKATKGLDEILSLFTDGISSIQILANRELNKHLEALAPLLSTYIARANGSVMLFLEREFAAVEC